MFGKLVLAALPLLSREYIVSPLLARSIYLERECADHGSPIVHFVSRLSPLVTHCLPATLATHIKRLMSSHTGRR